jgi:hypothetical protein
MADRGNQQIVVTIRIASGYQTRTFIASLKQLAVKVRWFFFDDRFLISDVFGTDEGSIPVFSEATFSSENLSEYNFDQSLVEESQLIKNKEIGKEELEEPCGYYWVREVNVGEMTGQLSSITKTEGIEIMVNVEGQFIIRPTDDGRNSGNFIHTVSASTPDNMDLIVFNHSMPENKPTCKVTTSVFQKMCGGIKKNNRDLNVKFNLSANGDGILVQPTTRGSGRIQVFGNYTPISKNIDNDDEMRKLIDSIEIVDTAEGQSLSSYNVPSTLDDENISILVPMSVLKALSKISTIAPMGMVTMYMDSPKVIKFKVPIQQSGIWRLCVSRSC